MRYTVSTVPSFHGTSWHLATFESYTVAVRALPWLADSHDCEVELWERDTVRARYMDGRVHFEPGAPIPA